MEYTPQVNVYVILSGSTTWPIWKMLRLGKVTGSR
jgi:hypothetical protein